MSFPDAPLLALLGIRRRVRRLSTLAQVAIATHVSHAYAREHGGRGNPIGKAGEALRRGFLCGLFSAEPMGTVGRAHINTHTSYRNHRLDPSTPRYREQTGVSVYSVRTIRIHFEPPTVREGVYKAAFGDAAWAGRCGW